LNTGDLLDSLAVTRRQDLTDAQWATLEPLLPAPMRGEGGSASRTARWVQVEPVDHALRRSRGGLTMKLHLACEQGRKPLSIVLTAGQHGDRPLVTPAAVLNTAVPKSR
jgi:transposase